MIGMAPALEIVNLVKRYGDAVAVDSISMSVEEGEIFGILGPNGAGKTTIVECVQGLRAPTSGGIRVFGHDAIGDRSAVRSLMGSQLQESGLPARLKVWEALDLFARDAEARTSWRELLSQWDLTKKESAIYGSLSGGERQRLFLALALVNRPKIVFLDEITQGLDPTARRMTWDHISEIRQQGTTVVLVTHFMEEAEALCDRISIIQAGKVIAEGTPLSLTRAGRTTVMIPADSPISTDLLDGMEGVSGIEVTQSGISVTGDGRIAQSVPVRLWEHGARVTDLRVSHPTLDEVYVDITNEQKETSDANAA